MDEMWDEFKICSVLEYNELREEQSLSATQAGLQHANHASEEQQDFASALDNLALADFSDKAVIAQLIAQKNVDRVRQTLTATIEILIQHGTGNMGQATQTFQEKSEIRRRKYV